MRDAGDQRQMERQHLEKGERRRAESLLLGRGLDMRQAGRGADKSRKWAKGQGQERVTARRDGRQGPSELVLVPT